MPVTTTYLPRGFARPRGARIPSIVTFAFVLPYGSTSSGVKPSSRATSRIGRGVTERAISRSDGNGAVEVMSTPAGCRIPLARDPNGLGLVLGGAHEVGEEERVGHGADAAGDRGDGGRHLARRVEVDVAHDPAVDDVDPDVDDDRARAAACR